MDSNVDAFKSLSKRSGVRNHEELMSYAIELVDEAKAMGGVDDGFKLADMVRKDRFTTHESQLVFTRLPEMSNGLITKDAVNDGYKILGLKALTNSSNNYSHVGALIRGLSNDFLTEFISKNDFESEKNKSDFINAIDINRFNDRHSPSPGELFMELKSGQLKHAFTVEAVTSLDKEMSTGVLKMMTHNSVLEQTVKKDDLKTFIGHMRSLDHEKQDLFIDDFLESGKERHVKFAEAFIQYEVIKDNAKPGQSYRSIAAAMGLDSTLAAELERLEPDFKPASPMYGLDLTPGK